MKLIIAASALAALSTAALAAPAQRPAEEQPRAERKICRTEKATGSLTRRTRICLTAAQWRELNDRTRRGVDEMVGGASGGCRAPSDPRAGTMCGG